MMGKFWKMRTGQIRGGRADGRMGADRGRTGEQEADGRTWGKREADGRTGGGLSADGLTGEQHAE